MDKYIDEQSYKIRNALADSGMEVTPLEVQEALERLFLSSREDCERCRKSLVGVCLRCFLIELLGEERFKEWWDKWTYEEKRSFSEGLQE